MHFAEGRLIRESEKFRKRYFAMKDKKKRVDIPSDNSSENLNPYNPSDPCSLEVERFSDRFSSDFEAQRPTNEKKNISAISFLSVGQKKVFDCIQAICWEARGNKAPEMAS